MCILFQLMSAFNLAVRACIYRDDSHRNPLEIVQLEEDNGVWSTKRPKGWEGCYYVYEVSVCHPSTQKNEKAMPMIHMLYGMLVVSCSSKVIQK